MKKIALIASCVTATLLPMQKPEDLRAKTEVFLNFKNFASKRQALMKAIGLYVSNHESYPQEGYNWLAGQDSLYICGNSLLLNCVYDGGKYCNKSLESLHDIDTNLKVRMKKQEENSCNSFSDYFGFPSSQCKNFKKKMKSEANIKLLEEYTKSVSELEESLKNGQLAEHKRMLEQNTKNWNEYNDYQSKNSLGKAIFKAKAWFNK